MQKIAGIACREISGVHAMGASISRAFGAVRERIPGSSGPNVAQGVGVEVGETQAAIDLDIVVEYGVSIADLGRSIQRNVKQAVERMTGLEVIEVNIAVNDIQIPGAEDGTDVVILSPYRSLVKPFVYATALTVHEGRGFTAATFLDDSPLTLTVDGAAWSPRNYEDRYLGRVTVREIPTTSSVCVRRVR